MPDAAAPPLAGRLCLNLGCGAKLLHGWINIDRENCWGHGEGLGLWFLRRDILRGLPFGDDTADEILADNVLEHIAPGPDSIFAMNECYRVLKPGGLLTIIVPDARSEAGWQDPTHLRAFVPRSALYWTTCNPYAKSYGAACDFDVQVEELDPQTGERFLRFICRAVKPPRRSAI